MGIHYDYKSKRGERAMLKEAKKKARLAQRKEKRLLSSEPVGKEEVKTAKRNPIHRSADEQSWKCFSNQRLYQQRLLHQLLKQQCSLH